MTNDNTDDLLPQNEGQNVGSIEPTGQIYNRHMVVARSVDDVLSSVERLQAASLEITGVYWNKRTDGQPYHVFGGHWIEPSEEQSDRAAVNAMFAPNYVGAHSMTPEQHEYSERAWARSGNAESRFDPSVVDQLRGRVPQLPLTPALAVDGSAGVDPLSRLPVFQPEPTDIVNDRRTKRFASQETLKVVARTEGGDIVGKDPAGVFTIASADAFTVDSIEVGDRFTLPTRFDGHELAFPLGIDSQTNEIAR